MKQIIQSFKTGATILEELPAPQVKKGAVLIQTTRSLVSLGTERMLVEFGKSNLVSKARQQPDKVKQVLDKIKTEGLVPTLEAVFNKLGEPLPLGYCNVGRVIAVGEGVSEFKVGDRVASNGQHAEFVCIPKNLVAHIPDETNERVVCFYCYRFDRIAGYSFVKSNIGRDNSCCRSWLNRFVNGSIVNYQWLQGGRCRYRRQQVRTGKTMGYYPF